MKQLLFLSLILFTVTAKAQILTSFTATQQAQLRAALKITADQVTDSSKAATVISRVKAIEKFNATTALIPDTLTSFTIAKGILYTKPVDLAAVKKAITDIQTAIDTLSKTVGDNKTLFDALKARIDNLKLIFQIQ